MKVKAKKIVIAGILVTAALVLGVVLKGNKQMPQTVEEEMYSQYTTTIGTQTLDITNLVTTTPSAPELSAGMIPIKYTGTFWTITTADDPEWYNYNTGKPAYIMLNDGVYQSELKPNMTNKKLAQTGIQLNTSNMGTIFLWVPRFAYNSSGTVIYMKPETSVTGTWTIPNIFKYEISDSTKRDYSLTGVWLEYETGSVSTNTMTQENSVYGFLANIKAERLSSSAGISYYNTYLTNKGGTTPIKNPTYTTRRILKVINEQYAEPLKVNAVYQSKKITVTVTQNINNIAKILDKNGKQLSTNSTTANTGSVTIGDGVYTYIIIDVKGNCKQVSVTVSNTGIMTITNEADLINLRAKVNSGTDYSGQTIVQAADITLTSSWTPIGIYSTTSSKCMPFSGTYDGGGYSISNLNISASSTDNRGLFGYIESGTVKNLVIKSGTIKGANNVGAICGNAKSVTIENCGNKATVSGSMQVGGILGRTNGGTIRACYNKGNITGTGARIGGIFGGTTAGLPNIYYCYNRGTVKTSSGYVGGIMGGGNSNSGTVYYSYNTGTITSNKADYAGGILGTYGGVSYSYYLDTSATYRHAREKSTTGAVSAATLKGYASTLGSTYFKTDTNNINGGYPILSWES